MQANRLAHVPYVTFQPTAQFRCDHRTQQRPHKRTFQQIHFKRPMQRQRRCRAGGQLRWRGHMDEEYFFNREIRGKGHLFQMRRTLQQQSLLAHVNSQLGFDPTGIAKGDQKLRCHKGHLSLIFAGFHFTPGGGDRSGSIHQHVEGIGSIQGVIDDKHP